MSVCNKWVEMIEFGCGCGQSLWRLHRMLEEHTCKFDSKGTSCAILDKECPVCVAYKSETKI
ncbi:putative transcription regulator A20-like family [Helianthus anomalus]